MSVKCNFQKLNVELKRWDCVINRDDMCRHDECILKQVQRKGERIETLLEELKEAYGSDHQGKPYGPVSNCPVSFTFDSKAGRWRPVYIGKEIRETTKEK